MKVAKTRPALARVTEAAEFLNVSRPYIYKLIAQGIIPARKIGNTVRIPWSWLDSQAKESIDTQ